MQSRKKKLPSRLKYEEANPTISCRVSREIYDRLQAVTRAEGKSFADILKAGLGILEVKMGKEAPIREKAHQEGYEEGYDAAVVDFGVPYCCSVCGELTLVDSEEAKESAGQFMEQEGWGHAECHKGGDVRSVRRTGKGIH